MFKKAVVDTFVVRKCAKKVCKCMVELKEKKHISLRDVSGYKECFRNATINEIIKVRLAFPP